MFDAKPSTTIITVEPLVRETAPAMTFQMESITRHGWYAKVEHLGETLHISRFHDEDRWIVDGRFRGSLPIFHNGVGSRCTALEEAPAEVQAALDFALQAAARAGTQNIVK